MNRHYAIFVLLSIAVIAAGCARQEGEVLAKVNDKVITLREFNKKIERLPKHYQDIVNAQKDKFLEEIISEELLYQEGQRQGIDQDEETREMVAEAEKKIVVSRFINDNVNEKVAIEEDELRKYYDEHSEEFMLPERWRASHILLDTRQEAEEVLGMLRSGSDFATLAQERSKDASAKQGGDVGFFSKGQLLPDFEDTAFELEVGQISEITETQFGYHLIKLTERKSPEVQDFGKIKDLIKKELERNRRKEVFDSILSDLREKADIAINEELIGEEEDKAEVAPDTEG